ncbi:MAG: acetyl/propionyl/methylcrotonyl-CoA carboxylase subunit alpha [Rickettsiales bacterium]|jgi:propionyl-CoA carboxylase alpha chain|nr:acetyl/propionyl/methylcrotonyl-CoA carboxylase subunit alpha [Rickettsiales bacterium]
MNVSGPTLLREKLLIANRGEVACRIIKTAKKMGIATIAVYSDADSNSLHVQMADEAVLLGGAPASESYLDIKKIINVAKKTGATYVHPGYGFLSENVKFAAALEAENIVFIAPTVDAIRKMGDKIESKKIARKAGVNVVPGYNGVIKNSEEALKIAKKIGLPVMVKASAGGGGKGIRMVDSLDDLEEAFEIATNEAMNSFGDNRLFIEKYVQDPRHIEIQVIADKYGNIVCLGERECSIQRNNQKIIEEAPSSFLDDKLRNKMYRQVISLCKEVNYSSAGTVEFMMDQEKKFYFLEMNTRLQVEHGVSEMITGLDIVELMIRIAKGEKLPFRQEDIKLNGWAMESRICSEDPSRGFLPSSGRINKYVEPLLVGNVRVDSSAYEGYEVTSFYDNMICKLLTHGKNRDDCLEKMQSALGSFYIDGITHNIGFLETITYNDRFKRGDINTNFIKQEFSSGFSNNELELKHKNPLIGVALYMFFNYQRRVNSITGGIVNLKKKFNSKWVVDVDGRKFLANVDDSNDGSFNVDCNSWYGSLVTAWQYGENVFRGAVNGKQINVKILSDDYAGNYIFQYMGSTIAVSVRNTRISELEQFMPVRQYKETVPTSLKSPINGRIVKIKVNEGDSVVAGAELCSVEAMKMENILRSNFSLKIGKIYSSPGDLVDIGSVIMDFEGS